MAFVDDLSKQIDASAFGSFGPIERRALQFAMDRIGMKEYPPVVGNPDGERACGDCLCDICGHDYFSHPLDWRVIGYGNVPFLNVLCDGSRVKL